MKYIIHRGITSNKIKENTYESIKKALNDKTSAGVEFDIRLTKDKKIVLFHDPLINFSIIENTNYQDIIKENYLWTLDKILSINTNKILLIDIKVNKNYKVFGETIIKYLKNYNRNIYLCSFNKKIIKYLKKKTKYKVGNILFKYKSDKNDFTIVNHKGISSKEINKIKNKKIFLWTINNTKELKEVKTKFTNINNYYLIIDKEE